MSNTSVASVGRFSSQMLTYFGTQKTVKLVGDSYVNTFKYQSGPTTFVDPASLLQSDLGGGVTGSLQSSYYDSTRCYFLSRGVGIAYAETMTALALDMALQLGISPQEFLEKSESFLKLDLLPDAYRAFNNLRDPGNQVGVVTTPSNKSSLQSRQIRS